MTTWITADTHFGHNNIIALCDRCIEQGGTKRSFKNSKEMDDHLIERWNSCVKPTDIVHHLGDFAFGNPARYANRLHGNIHLYLGNHDRFKEYGVSDVFASISYVRMIVVEDQKIWLSHYAHRTWPSAHHGVWHLYGHSHGTLPDLGNLSFDVGVDSHNFYPWSFEEIAAEMGKRKFIPNDHHGQEN